jgi:hypothetical protein
VDLGFARVVCNQALRFRSGYHPRTGCCVLLDARRLRRLSISVLLAQRSCLMAQNKWRRFRQLAHANVSSANHFQAGHFDGEVRGGNAAATTSPNINPNARGPSSRDKGKAGSRTTMAQASGQTQLKGLIKRPGLFLHFQHGLFIDFQATGIGDRAPTCDGCGRPRDDPG